MRPLVIYHGGCWDGFCAAWCARGALGPDADFVPALHGTDPPYELAQGRDVYVLDFSYRRPAMLLLASRAANLCVLDHHATARADLDGLADEAERKFGLNRPSVKFSETHSGACMAWSEFHPGEAPPWVVLYVEDRDLWRWALPDSREVCAWLRSNDMDFALLDECAKLSAPPWDYILQGRAILRVEARLVSDHVARAKFVDIGGYRVPAVNATCLHSEIAGELAKGHPFGAVWYERGDGLRAWSLRSEPGGADVSGVARALGGGGHKRAAGFERRGDL